MSSISISEANPNMIVTRIGRYKASKVGTGYKISIPKEISQDVWELRDEESVEVIMYAEEREGEICVLVSRKPLSGDLLRKKSDPKSK
ncbi:MAG: hypothetical protein ACW98K_07200 [Candidatus Kariarchaeaceae archaeon]